MRLLVAASDSLVTPVHEDWLVAGEALRVLGGHAATKRRSFWNDVLIAASCLRAHATLVTSNADDFRRIRKVIPVDTAPAWDSGGKMTRLWAMCTVESGEDYLRALQGRVPIEGVIGLSDRPATDAISGFRYMGDVAKELGIDFVAVDDYRLAAPADRGSPQGDRDGRSVRLRLATAHSDLAHREVRRTGRRHARQRVRHSGRPRPVAAQLGDSARRRPLRDVDLLHGRRDRLGEGDRLGDVPHHGARRHSVRVPQVRPGRRRPAE